MQYVEKITDLPEDFLKNYNESPDEYDNDDVLWYLEDDTHMSVEESSIFLWKSRWYSRYKTVLFDATTGKYWAFEYNSGNSEIQDDTDPDIEVYEVERKVISIFDYPKKQQNEKV